MSVAPDSYSIDGSGLLKRVLARNSGELWELETRMLHRVGLTRPPLAVQWLATMACDLKCPHCYVSAGTKSRNELSTDEVKHLIIDPMVELGCRDLVVAGGEPLLRKDISEVLGYAQERGIRWSMHTHGGFVRDCLPWIEKTTYHGGGQYAPSSCQEIVIDTDSSAEVCNWT